MRYASPLQCKACTDVQKEGGRLMLVFCSSGCVSCATHTHKPHGAHWFIFRVGVKAINKRVKCDHKAASHHASSSMLAISASSTGVTLHARTAHARRAASWCLHCVVVWVVVLYALLLRQKKGAQKVLKITTISIATAHTFPACAKNRLTYAASPRDTTS